LRNSPKERRLSDAKVKAKIRQKWSRLVNFTNLLVHNYFIPLHQN